MTDSTDDSFPELEPGLAAASAHFDGVADDHERALVDGSEELRSTVASFAAVKAVLNDLPPVPATELDDTLAAALAEFDSLGAAPAAAAAAFAVPRAAGVVAHPQRARWSRVLAVAAAAAIIGVVGVAIAKNVGTDHSASSTAAEKGFDATTVAGLSGGAVSPPLATGGVAGAAGPASTIGAINAPADALPSYDQPSDLRNLPGTEQDAQASTGDTGVPAVPAASGTPGQNGVPLTGPVVFPFTCPLTSSQVFIAEISWKGTPAAAVRDTVTGVTQAIDPQCKVLASTP
jgi:hypothetical protein